MSCTCCVPPPHPAPPLPHRAAPSLPRHPSAAVSALRRPFPRRPFPIAPPHPHRASATPSRHPFTSVALHLFCRHFSIALRCAAPSQPRRTFPTASLNPHRPAPSPPRRSIPIAPPLSRRPIPIAPPLPHGVTRSPPRRPLPCPGAFRPSLSVGVSFAVRALRPSPCPTRPLGGAPVPRPPARPRIRPKRN